LKGSKTYHIGVLIGNAGTEHPREIITGVYDCVREENVEMTLFLGTQGQALDFWKQTNEITSSTYNYQYNNLYDYALLGEMDALVVSYGTICIFFSAREQDAFLSKFEGIPMVVLEAYNQGEENTYLITDNYQGQYDLIEHLASVHGYRKILYLSGPHNSIEASLRKKAYYDVMQKYGLPVTDSMVIEGDFTHKVEPLIEKLLDDNPDTDALACANDEMAAAAYNVCKRRNIAIGTDLAITGYDDVDISMRLDPPLTTVNQDGVAMGYEAIKAVLNTCRGEKEESRYMPAPLQIRGSCGCDFSYIKEDKELLESYSLIESSEDYSQIYNTALVAFDLVKRNRNVPYSYRQLFINSCKRLLSFMLKIRNNELPIDDREYISQAVLGECRKVFNSNFAEFRIHYSLSKTLNIVRMILDYESTKCNDNSVILTYSIINSAMSSYIETLVAHYNEESTAQLRLDNHMISYAIQSLMECSDNDKLFYTRVMNILKERKVNNAFLYLNETPIRLVKGQETSCPDSMFMAVQMVNGVINVMPSKNVRITKTSGFANFYPDDEIKHQYSAVLLFQEEEQYGLLVAEASFDVIDDLQCIALQISTALSYKDLRAKEAASRKELYSTLEKLEEKNKVLSLISSNDQLTSLYNRRGFMEQVLRMQNERIGKSAFLFFFDLDHLKEINDVFGHAEGDYAIINAANTLKSLFDNCGIISRLGGDEFVGVISYDDMDDSVGLKIINRLKDFTSRFNAASDKPYYIEMSTGYTSFVFDKSLDINEVLKQADSVLYEAKQKRRSTICK